MIAWYEDLPIVNGAPLLSDPLFWPTYLSATMAPHRDSLVAAAFGVDVEDCFGYFARLIDVDAWPAFRLALHNEYEIDIVYWNEPGENGTEYVLARSGRAGNLDLANVGGHEFRPGLNWVELLTAANSPDGGIADSSARMLLLLPIFGDADLSSDATTVVAAALMSCGAGAGAAELAAYLLRQPERWPHWRMHANGALICDGRYSRRNPEGPAGHTPVDLLEISSALARSQGPGEVVR